MIILRFKLVDGTESWGTEGLNSWKKYICEAWQDSSMKGLWWDSNGINYTTLPLSIITVRKNIVALIRVSQPYMYRVCNKKEILRAKLLVPPLSVLFFQFYFILVYLFFLFYFIHVYLLIFTITCLFIPFYFLHLNSIL